MRLQFHTFGTSKRKYFSQRSRARLGNFLQQKAIVINSTTIFLKRTRPFSEHEVAMLMKIRTNRNTHILSKDSLIFSVLSVAFNEKRQLQK